MPVIDYLSRMIQSISAKPGEKTWSIDMIEGLGTESRKGVPSIRAETLNESGRLHQRSVSSFPVNSPSIQGLLVHASETLIGLLCLN